MDKIYISEEFENTLFERLPLSTLLLTFLKRNKLYYLKQLQQTTPEIVEQIIKSQKKPFPELRRFIVQIQKSPSGQIILEQEIVNQSLIEQNSSEALLCDEINTPQNLKELPISYLLPSNKLLKLLKQNGFSLLKDLDGIKFNSLSRTPGFGNRSISELRELNKFINKFGSVTNFESILFASIKRKKTEESAREISAKENHNKDISHKPIKNHIDSIRKDKKNI